MATPTSIQDELLAAFLAETEKPGLLNASNLLNALTRELRHASDFTGLLRSTQDLSLLTDEQARLALTFLPDLQHPPIPKHVSEQLLRHPPEDR
jgi:hypothetical protein